MTLSIVERPSPNFNERPEGVAIDMLVLHYTGMPDAEGAMRLLTDGEAERRVSAHYTLDEDGTFYAHVPEHMRAWHAGVSWWRGRADVNSRSIGIEIVNPGHDWGYRPFPEAQIAALEEMAAAIIARHGIPARNVVGHSDVAPGRKIDPGELFPWARLGRAGIGIWADLGLEAIDDRPEAMADGLRCFGYGLAPEVPVDLAVVIGEFQRHFRPSRVDGVADLETRRTLAALLKQLDERNR